MIVVYVIILFSHLPIRRSSGDLPFSFIYTIQNGMSSMGSTFYPYSGISIFGPSAGVRFGKPEWIWWMMLRQGSLLIFSLTAIHIFCLFFVVVVAFMHSESSGFVMKEYDDAFDWSHHRWGRSESERWQPWMSCSLLILYIRKAVNCMTSSDQRWEWPPRVCVLQ